MPKSFYGDKHSIFRVNIKNAMNADARTQFERAMENLGIELINANSPQAKGRVERANQTLQDRLVKEMRLRELSDMAAGNDYLPAFIAEFNERFAIGPKSDIDVHQKRVDEEKVARELMLQNTRRLSKTLTFQYENQLYQIQVPGKGYTLRQARVTVCAAESGEIIVLYKGRRLNYSVYDKQMQHSRVVTDKELDTQAKPKQSKPYKPAANAPWRRFVINPQKASRHQAITMTKG